MITYEDNDMYLRYPMTLKGTAISHDIIRHDSFTRDYFIHVMLYIVVSFFLNEAWLRQTKAD